MQTTQLITPNPNVPCTPGMCLVYVRETYGIGPKYPTATAGWSASTHKHTDKDFPANVWVPLWFSLNDNPAGHVVLRQPDGSVWSASSPTSKTPIHHSSLAALQNYYENRLIYLGWTEDIEDTLIMDAAEPAVFGNPGVPRIDGIIIASDTVVIAGGINITNVEQTIGGTGGNGGDKGNGG